MATLLRASQVWLGFSGTTGMGTLLRYGYTSTRFSGVASLLRYYRYHRNSQLLQVWAHYSGMATLLHATQVWLGFSGTTGTTGILRYYMYGYTSQVWLHFYAPFRYGFTSQDHR
jgi:hypothetical protein